MLYRNNDDVIREIKAVAAREGISLSALAEKIGISQQNLSGVMHKKQLSFADVTRIVDTLGYDLNFELTKRHESQ